MCDRKRDSLAQLLSKHIDSDFTCQAIHVTRRQFEITRVKMKLIRPLPINWGITGLAKYLINQTLNNFRHDWTFPTPYACQPFSTANPIKTMHA